jgi:hypothetical protein
MPFQFHVLDEYAWECKRFTLRTSYSPVRSAIVFHRDGICHPDRRFRQSIAKIIHLPRSDLEKVCRLLYILAAYQHCKIGICPDRVLVEATRLCWSSFERIKDIYSIKQIALVVKRERARSTYHV